MGAIDTASYYYISTPELNNSRTVQWCGDQIICFSDLSPLSRKAYWQFVPAPDTAAFLLVNAEKGLNSSISSFLNSGLTQPGFSDIATQDPRQYWDWQTVDPRVGYTVSNVGNGTNWLLNVHNVTEGSLALVSAMQTTSSKQQHWILTSASPVPNMPQEVQDTQTIESKLVAAIVIPIFVLLVALNVAACFWFSRRRRQNADDRYLGTPTSVISRPSIITKAFEMGDSPIRIEKSDETDVSFVRPELPGDHRLSHATTAHL